MKCYDQMQKSKVNNFVSVSTSRQTPSVPTEAVWRFNVEQYHQMIRLNILTEDDPVELLEGVEKSFPEALLIPTSYLMISVNA
ncbi:hypothetical protein G7B40_005105 [Aetokthonos hydrillicola Thurmond2011]|uniref:Uncharacterized protein n=1 Tax=Aetokthonos hydrillicola Thurmond2011 TaxID=2712845 RepID=A0AAP5I564_9CYAN|nr:hypothetical protein [Aetokthonos hydrillicola]MBO3458261.1 hypothetical protein [Aetokthonos hydrillicola CCALA 1050]MBW4586722.1 hypothetical protein [Aetokthonos hydrillicola CCALA 1050]MDR9893952.1 hypothetical protein [Aetokthonos hydrillicola Thurmond2011]